MTATLPTPGGDANTWGDILNDYLQQSLAADGTLVTGATNSYTSLPNTNLAGVSNPGLVQLAGDLGNTAVSPQVTSTHLSSALPVNQGGTGAGTLTGLVLGNGTSAMTTVTAPSGTVVGTSDTQTLTNKRVTKRVLALSAGSATPAINTDNYDVVRITAQSAAITSFTTNLTGTPVSGDSLRISITDDGTARALTWGATFESSGNVALPTTTVSGVRLDVGFFWNTTSSHWRCVAVA